MSDDPTPAIEQGTWYAQIGDFLGEAYLDLPFARGTAQEVGFIMDQLGLRPGQRVLDVGCGPGRHAVELARRGLVVTGIDISPGFLDVARRHAEAAGVGATFLLQDARELTFEAEFDAVICLCEGAFGLVGDDAEHDRMLRGIHEALKPGGGFVLSAVNALSVAASTAADVDFDPQTSTYTERVMLFNNAGERRYAEMTTRSFTPRELRYMLGAAGLRVHAVYGCTAGQFAARPLTLKDREVMVMAERPV